LKDGRPRFDRPRKNLGCVNAWVLTDRGNAAAMGLYASCGGVEAPGDTVMFEFPLGATPKDQA
jgi:hypothetical protein